MRRIFFLLALLIFTLVLKGPNTPFLYPLVFESQRSALGTREDPMARVNYEAALLRNPTTGVIPQNIRKRELSFSSKIPSRKQWQEKSNLRTNSNDFELAGPFNVGGRTRAVAYDVLDERSMVAGGVSGGIWKTNDNGISWTRRSDPNLRNSISTIVQDKRPDKENIWYAGTGELVGNSAKSLLAPYRGAGILKSIDNGQSWFTLESTTDGATPDKFQSQFQYVWKIAVNEANELQEEVLAAAFGGVVRSLDGGNSWESVLGEKLFDLDAAADLNDYKVSFYTNIEQIKAGQLIATLSSATSDDKKLDGNAGFYFSTNGTDWQNITPLNFSTYHERTVIGSSADGKKVYFLTQGASQVILWLLEINGVSNGNLVGRWTNLSGNIPAFGGDFGNYESQSCYNMLIKVHPENDRIVFIGGTNLYRSTDGFASRNNTKWIGGYSPENDASIYKGHYADQHDLIFDAVDTRRAISANDGGIRFSTDILADSVSWTSRNNGYLTSQFYSIAQRTDEPTRELLGGMQDNGSYLADSHGENPAWNRILGGDGGYCAITPNRDYLYVSFQNSQIYRLTINSNYGLSSFARVDPSGGGGEDGAEYLFINPYILDPWNPSRMFLAGGSVLWRNDNLTQIPAGSQLPTPLNWTKIPGTRVGGSVYTALDKSQTADLLYAGALNNTPFIVKVEQASVPEKEIVSTITSPLFPTSGHIASISVHPEDEKHLVIVFSNYGVRSVFESTDGGSSFMDISANLEETIDGSGAGPSVRWVEIVPLQDELMYFVGTSTGVYSMIRTFSPSDTWMKDGGDVIGAAVVTMLDYRDVDGRLVVATHGNGTFQYYIDGFRKLANDPNVEDKVRLSQNYPNPFSGSTSIYYSIPEDGIVKVDIHDNAGGHIKNLLWGPQFLGESRLQWDGTNTAGNPVAPGIYFATLSFKSVKETKRIIFQP